MHPAKSVIFFTTASGAGYGMLVWLAVLAATGQAPADPIYGGIAFALAFSLIIGGLLSSTFHLGHPERAWRAFSQWRSSWLSREGVAALATFLPAGLFALSWMLGNNSGAALLLGLAGAALSLATVYATSMIYACLKAVPAWHTGWTRASYMTLALMTGAVLVNLLNHAWGYGASLAIGGVTLLFIIFGALVKAAYWRHVDHGGATSTAESATGLGDLGKVTLLDPPHTEENYLMREMGFRIARKHARTLRRIALWLGFVAPFIFTAMALVTPYGLGLAALFLAALSSGIGIVVERWLFFAEARHVVTLYYGAARV
ncbi:MAG: dimethyl sulfoxide reductase anchor subunit family protein [Pseudomonadota bacterium]